MIVNVMRKRKMGFKVFSKMEDAKKFASQRKYAHIHVVKYGKRDTYTIVNYITR